MITININESDVDADDKYHTKTVVQILHCDHKTRN